jgi:hypothetical protein
MPVPETGPTMNEKQCEGPSQRPGVAGPPGTTTSADRVMGNMMVVAVGGRQGTIDCDPVFAVDLLMTRPGMSPQLWATSLRVPVGAADRFVVGSEVPVELSRSDPSVFEIDWARLDCWSAGQGFGK